MKVYKCILSGDVVMSDAFPQLPVKNAEGEEVDGAFMVKSKMVAKGGGDVDIGAGNAFGGGGEDELDDSVETVNNIVDADTGFGYVALSYTKSELKSDLKEWMKALRKKLKENGVEPSKLKEEFVPKSIAFCNFCVKNFDNLEMYMTQGQVPTPESSMMIGYYEGADATPSFLFFSPGLEEEKY